jgi:hypothetical protein
MIAKGPAKAQGSEAKSASRIRATQSKLSEGQSDTRGGRQLALSGTHRGDMAPSIFVFESRPGGFLHALCVGWHLAVRVFSPGIT